MLRGSRVRFAEGIAPRITRIYTYEGGGNLRGLRAIWSVVGHWQRQTVIVSPLAW